MLNSKNIKLFFLAMISLQVLGYLTVSQNKLSPKHFSELKMFVSEIDHLGIFTEEFISERQKEKIIKILKPKYGKIEFAQEENDYYENYRSSDTRYGIYYVFEYEFPFIVKVLESNGTRFYGENWETKYIWIVFDWFLIEKKCTGQS